MRRASSRAKSTPALNCSGSIGAGEASQPSQSDGRARRMAAFGHAAVVDRGRLLDRPAQSQRLVEVEVAPVEGGVSPAQTARMTWMYSSVIAARSS